MGPDSASYCSPARVFARRCIAARARAVGSRAPRAARCSPFSFQSRILAVPRSVQSRDASVAHVAVMTAAAAVNAAQLAPPRAAQNSAAAATAEAACKLERQWRTTRPAQCFVLIRHARAAFVPRRARVRAAPLAVPIITSRPEHALHSRRQAIGPKYARIASCCLSRSRWRRSRHCRFDASPCAAAAASNSSSTIATSHEEDGQKFAPWWAKCRGAQRQAHAIFAVMRERKRNKYMTSCKKCILNA